MFKNNFFSKLYLKPDLSGGVVALYTNRQIKEMAVGLLGLFLPIFLFQIYGSINLVLLFYLISFSLYLFLVVPGAIFATKITFNKAMLLSIFGGIFYYVSLIFFELNILLFSALAILAITLSRILYWVPYHSGFAKFTDRKTRGRTIGLLSSVSSLFKIFLPIVAGFIIAQYGFNVLFILVIAVYAASIIPLTLTPLINEYYTFSYFQTWKILFHPRDRKILITYMAEGAEGIIGAVIWPIFIWQVLAGNYQVVGLVASLIVLVTIVLKLLMGKYTDQFSKKKLLKYGTVLYSLGWVLKIFVETAFQIFVVAGYHQFSSVVMRTPFETLMYEKAADAGHYVDEYTVLREMSLNIGRILTLVVLMIFFNFFGLQYAFIFGAIAALFINFI